MCTGIYKEATCGSKRLSYSVWKQVQASKAIRGIEAASYCRSEYKHPSKRRSDLASSDPSDPRSSKENHRASNITESSSIKASATIQEPVSERQASNNRGIDVRRRMQMCDCRNIQILLVSATILKGTAHRSGRDGGPKRILKRPIIKFSPSF